MRYDCSRAGRFIAVFTMAASLVACASVPADFAPRDPLPAAAFTHAGLDAVLMAHVHDGEVDYPAIVQDEHFARYIARLDRVDPATLDDRQKLAFWINAYNAFAIEGVLGGSTPLTWGGKYRFFVADKHRVGGQELNLYGLEHRILIPLGEPRIHFAIVCAARSCPALRSEAYVAAELDRQLDAQARRFINNPDRNRFDERARVAHLSKIFDWFEDEFTRTAGSELLHYIAPYVDDPALARSLKVDAWDVTFRTYDWHPNGPLPETAP